MKVKVKKIVWLEDYKYAAVCKFWWRGHKMVIRSKPYSSKKQAKRAKLLIQELLGDKL